MNLDHSDWEHSFDILLQVEHNKDSISLTDASDLMPTTPDQNNLADLAPIVGIGTCVYTPGPPVHM